MRILIYIVVLASLLLMPVEKTDVGKLIPVEVIAISASEGRITVNTDTGERGEGATLMRAFENLKETASGVIYLDTAEYLLVETEMEIRDVMTEYLKGNVRVYCASADIPLEEIADYLSVHKSKIRLNDRWKTEEIPRITWEEGRYLIEETKMQKNNN